MTSTGRPQLHLTPRSGWVNDPYGLTWHGGAYHLFFQHLPGRVEWGHDQSWGHAVSPDLLHWSERPVALAPGDGDDGVWSGSLVVPPEGEAAIFYTSVCSPDLHLGEARLARPVDASWVGWRKDAGVRVGAPDGVDLVALRDPYVLREGSLWRMVMGAGLAGGTAAALTWTSPDLETWTYDGVLASRPGSLTDPVWTGSVWECPQLFELDGRWVLVVSVWESEVTHTEAYAVGDLVGGRFTASAWGRLSHGPGHYAASAFLDRDGRRGLLHWIREVTDPGGLWAGTHSLPHAVALDGDRLVLSPHPCVDAARQGPPVGLDAVSGVLAVDGPLDVELELAEGGVLALAAGVTLTAAGGQLHVRDQDTAWSLPLLGTSLRVLVDGPVVEVLGPGGTTALVLREAPRPAVSGAASAQVWRLA